MKDIFKCKQCGKEFEVKSQQLKRRKNIGFCSTKCSNVWKGKNISFQKKKLKNEKISKSMKQFYRLHRKNKKYCKICGKLIQNSKRKFCCEQHYLLWRKNKKIYDPEYCNKARQITIKLIQEGKIKSWQSRNIDSYPQKFFKKVFQLNSIQFQKEKKVDKYFLDFVIITKCGLIDVQIDGKQHLYQENIQHDKIRDEKISNLGYKVYRIPWNEINSKNGKNKMKEKIKNFLQFLKEMNK